MDLAEGEDVTPASSGAENSGLRELEELWLLSREDSIAVPRQPGVRGDHTEVLAGDGDDAAAVVGVGREPALCCSIVVVGQALI